MTTVRFRIRGCCHNPPHPSFQECTPENDAWMFPGSNEPVPETEGASPTEPVPPTPLVDAPPKCPYCGSDVGQAHVPAKETP